MSVRKAIVGSPWTGCSITDRTGLRFLATKSSSTFPQRVDMKGDLPYDAFHYTSGRWLYNESLRLQERQLSFNLPALVKAAATSTGRSDTEVKSVQKLSEGGFNRVFKLTMNDGFELIARLPYPLTQPKRLAVASEVATMIFLRSHDVPVPKVYDYHCDSANPVGTEYILMERVRGRCLGDVWFNLSDKERIKVISGVVEAEAKLFAIDLPAYGSIFYEKDLPAFMNQAPLQSGRLKESLCVGPDVSLKFWFEERSSLNIERGPSLNAADVLRRAASKEIAWLQTYGRPRLPFDRIYRDITNFQKSSPQEHMEHLKSYLEVTPQLLPKDEWLLRPILRHPDLNPNNIFVSEDYSITGIIDWQHSNILPLFLNASIPAHFQNYGDPDSDQLIKPQPPSDLEEMDEDDQEKELEQYRRRHVHFYYVGATATKLDLHFQALMQEENVFRRKIYQHASEPWEGNNIPLKADLVTLAQQWKELVCEDSLAQSPPDCPLAFSDEETEESLEDMAKQEEVDVRMAILRNAIGINIDGWVSTERYEEAVARAAAMKVQALSYADDDFERDMTLRHWPFDDHDEKE